MKVYLAEYDGPGGYGDWRFILGIFKSYKAAMAACSADYKIRKYRKEYVSSTGYHVEEHTLEG